MSETTTTTAQAPPDGTVEAQGADIEAAIVSALSQLGIGRENAAIEILSQPAPAVPGETLSSSDARVRVTRIDEHTARGKAMLEELLGMMRIEANVTVRRAAGSTKAEAATPPMILDVRGDDLGLLIGWRGETLRSVQTVLNLMLGEDAVDHEGRRLIVDVERYRARREDQVRDLALRLAARVKRSGERYTLDPMHAYERRVVHIALENDEGVRTESTGKEPARRIVIHPTGPPQGGEYPRRRWRER